MAVTALVQALPSLTSVSPLVVPKNLCCQLFTFERYIFFTVNCVYVYVSVRLLLLSNIPKGNTFEELNRKLSQKLWAGLHDNVLDRPSDKVLQLLGANWRPWHFKLKLSLSQKVGCAAEVVTQSGTSVHQG